LLWTPALTVAILWWARTWVPGALGSGIPQVVRALSDDLAPSQRAWLVSLRVALHKVGLVSAGLLAGLSIGREGPTVQVGAGVMVQEMPTSLLLPGLLVSLVAGLSGGLFARLIVVSMRGLPDRFSRWRVAHPFRFAAGCGLAVAVIGWATEGATAGAGYRTTRALLEGQEDMVGVYTLLKFCATWLSAWSGVPAGTFAPSLAIGAGIGHDVAYSLGIGEQAAIPLIALGMVGFLAAATGGPLTAFIIVMEMVSGHAMVLSLMACAWLSSGVAHLVARPMYLELASLLPVPPAVETPEKAP
jgi:H+/Cl- antiporter ClcA